MHIVLMITVIYTKLGGLGGGGHCKISTKYKIHLKLQELHF